MATSGGNGKAGKGFFAGILGFLVVNYWEFLTSAAKKVSKDAERTGIIWRTVFMLPKFTNKERDFFKKLGDDSLRAEYEKSFFQSWTGILLAIALAGGLAGLVFHLWP